MLVYRVCSQREIDYILNNHKFIGIGGFGREYSHNNHHYQEKMRYMHFFLSKKSVIYHGFYPGLYVCTYDIPSDIIEPCHGIGQYSGRKDVLTVYLDEYAIITEEMQFEYLKKVEQFLPQKRRYNLDNFEEYLIVKYESEKGILRERKKEGVPS